MKSVICIAGPTASGKSGLAVRLAKAVDGEILNADSMQVYGDLQVLSARPSTYEMEGVPEDIAREAFALAAAKLPFKTVFVKRTAM